MLADVETSFDGHQGPLDLRITQEIKQMRRAGKMQLTRKMLSNRRVPLGSRPA